RLAAADGQFDDQLAQPLDEVGPALGPDQRPALAVGELDEEFGERVRDGWAHWDSVPPPSSRVVPSRRRTGNSNHTTLPRAVGVAPHRAASASTRSSPRPLMASTSVGWGTGRCGDGSSTSTRTTPPLTERSSCRASTPAA